MPALVFVRLVTQGDLSKGMGTGEELLLLKSEVAESFPDSVGVTHITDGENQVRAGPQTAGPQGQH